MIFNSLEYFVFFIVSFCFYWFVLGKTLKGQNIFLLIASYFFYGWWDWRFLGLIAFSSCLDYFLGIGIADAVEKSKKKLFLFISLFFNLGLLGVFKYYNFFVGSLQDALQSLGADLNFTTLNVILPVGISFYTFQTLSYSIDIYRGNLKPTKDFISFCAFVSFFPQLVAGPIERAKNLLPQFLTTREFKHADAILATRQILWGFFKKVVIADNCAVYVDEIFANYEVLPGWVLVIGVLLFAFQLYGDFSGYSDIAIGTAKLLGFNLMQNFNAPYFAISISDLWRRWHISLSSWAMDYIFLPLTSSLKWLKKKTVAASLFLTFLILGIWHGANWTFFVFGTIHGLAVMTENRFKTDVKIKRASTGKKIFGWFRTMLIWLLGLIFFRSDSVTNAFGYLNRMRYKSGDEEVVAGIFQETVLSSRGDIFNTLLIVIIASIVIMLLFEWKNKNELFGFKRVANNIFVRYGFYILFTYLVMEFFMGKTTFIYFQF